MADSLDPKCWYLVEKYLMLILDWGLRRPLVNPLRATHPYSYLPHKYTKYHRRAPRYQIHITKYKKWIEGNSPVLIFASQIHKIPQMCSQISNTHNQIPKNELKATQPYSYLPHKYTKYHRRAPRYQIHITKYQKMNWGQLTRTHIRLTNTQNTTDMLLNINSYLPHKQGPAGRGVWLRDGTGTRIPSGPTHKYTKYHIHVAN